jgi:protein TonB
VSAQEFNGRITGQPGEPGEGPARTAVAAAILLHAAIALWLFAGSRPPRAPEPPVMVVTLVQEQPPPAPRAAAPAPPKPKEPLASRSSGPDEKTTMPAPADQPAPKPEAAAEKPAPAAEDALAPVAPVAPAPPRNAAEPEKTKHVPPLTEPRKLASRGPIPPLKDAEIGEREEMGDPYLNALWSRIEDQRAPTTPIGPSGLHLEGLATWDVLLNRSGAVESLSLVRSSGSNLLDAEARRMIVAAAPFPAPPAEFPEQFSIKVTIRLFPR